MLDTRLMHVYFATASDLPKHRTIVYTRHFTQHDVCVQ